MDSLGSLFRPEMASSCDFVFIKSSSDIGVERNGGRNGARLAPQSFLAYFKKLNIKPTFKNKTFHEIEISSELEEKSNFDEAQLKEAQRISQIIKLMPKSFICHLGGGHDHIFPLLMAISSKYKKVIVVNIDAHADTRIDADFHSGTPFRQFAEQFKGEFHLYQIGLLNFSNSASTLSPLKKGQSKILWRNELEDPQKLPSFFQHMKLQIDAETAVIFSLDADAINGSDMPGVSAVNGNGLTRAELNQIWSLYRELPLSHQPIVGFYELNPVYDTLSMLSMRTLGTFLYECL